MPDSANDVCSDDAPSQQSIIRSTPFIVWIAIALTAGIALGEFLPAAPGHFLLLTMVWLICAQVLRRKNQRSVTASVTFLLPVMLLGVCRWQLVQQESSGAINDLALEGRVIVNLQARIASAPVVHVKPKSPYAPRFYGDPQQIRFEIETIGIRCDGETHAVTDRCLVYVEGDASTRLCAGDEISVLGSLDWPEPPGNPGEFDFARLLERRQIAGMLFVSHPDSIKVLSPASAWNLWRWVSVIRSEAGQVISRNVDRDVQGVALALLLGERTQIPAETERDFVASGTMHLLAISGLHVGILCLFLLRLCNLLIVCRRTALILTLAVCLMYAMVTDLRPSVVRATVFFTVFVIAEFTGRGQKMPTLIATTVLLMTAAQPAIVFDTGAWLSFLSVAALGWVDSRTVEDRDAPLDALTPTETFLALMRSLWKWLAFRYRQMLAILALTTPLVAATFHVISPIGLLINVILIPLTGLVLCAGFVTVAVGLLLPAGAIVPGYVFSSGLHFLAWIVHATADLHAGHIYVPDFPSWFVPAYYGIMVSLFFIPAGRLRRGVILGLFACVLAAFAAPGLKQQQTGLHCTILNVGHGSGAIVELQNGQVFLVDAGAMNKGERTAEIVCRYLWDRGHVQLSGIVISHPDLDHYNAVPEIVERIPVAEFITSQRFVTSDSDSVRAVLGVVEQQNIPVRIAMDGDVVDVAGAQLRVFQADQLAETAADNEDSLVVSLEFAGRTILLPGDLEAEGTRQLLERLPQADVLVSPHHGSPNANTRTLAQTIRPQHLIVSARDASNAERLYESFPEVENIRFTSDSGAVSIRIDAAGGVSLSEFLSN